MNRSKSFWFSFVVFILLIGCFLGAGYWATKHPFKLPPAQVNFQPGYYRVIKFDDGDTIVVNMDGHNETVRMIGVDTPETKDPRKPVQCYGHEASDFTKNLIGTNAVRLESDPLNTNRDRYNRLLRYVYLPDGRLIETEIIKQGYGFAYLGFPFEKKNEFKADEDQARQANIGLWAACHPFPNQYGGWTSNNAN